MNKATYKGTLVEYKGIHYDPDLYREIKLRKNALLHQILLSLYGIFLGIVLAFLMN